jgi:hypothetical protein
MATREDNNEALRMLIVDLYNEIGGIEGTIKKCVRELGPLGWNEDSAEARAQEALAQVENSDSEVLREHINALCTVLANARDTLNEYKEKTDSMPGHGGMTGIFIKSGINRVNRVIEIAERELTKS